jgi:HlyD family secretion protein
MKKRLAIIGVIVAVAAAIAVTRKIRGNGDPNLLRISGNIELTEVDMSFKYPGRLVELAVDEGDPVKRGQIVAAMDRAEWERQLERERATVASTESGLVQLRTAITFQREAIGGDLDLRRADLRQAEARLGELLAGSRAQEIEQARAVLAEAQVQHEQARRDYDRAQKLFKDDDISAAQFDQFKARFDGTAASLRRAAETLKLVEEGPRKEQIEQARAAVERARAALRLAEANRIDLQRREQEIPMRQADIRRASAQAGVLETQLADRTLASPVDGVVLTRSAEPGEVLPAGATVLTLGDIERPWVRGYIAESDLGRVKLGMTARILTDSYPGKTYEGKVTFISSEAEFTPKQIQTQEERVKLVYRIKIEVPNPHRELKSNMPVDAEIRVQ